nr:cytosolic invertase 1 [Quercus suber]
MAVRSIMMVRLALHWKASQEVQTWSISGYLIAKMMIENPSNLVMTSLEEDKRIANPRLHRSASFPA